MAKGKYQEWLTPEGLLKLEGWARDGLTNEQIAEKIGISRKTLQDWINKYGDICDTLKRGKEVIDRQVENALLKRALGYQYVEVTRERIIDTGQKNRHDGVQALTENQWEFGKAYFNNQCCYCGKNVSLTKDHLKPLSDGGGMTRDNIVPCCAFCNSSKKDNEWMSWFQRQKFYDKYRAQKIRDYIEFVTSLEVDLNRREKDDGVLVITKEVTKEVAPEVGAQCFWLKNRKPDQWRDKHDVEHSGGVNVLNAYLDMPEEELKELAKKYETINKE